MLPFESQATSVGRLKFSPSAPDPGGGPPARPAAAGAAAAPPPRPSPAGGAGGRGPTSAYVSAGTDNGRLGTRIASGLRLKIIWIRPFGSNLMTCVDI